MNSAQKHLETKLNEVQNKIADWVGKNLTAQQVKELFPLVNESTIIQSKIAVEIAIDTVFEKLKETKVDLGAHKLIPPHDGTSATLRDNSRSGS